MKVREEYCWAITLAMKVKAYSIKYRVFMM